MSCTSSRPNHTQLSKKLSWLLRHGAHKLGLPVGADGYISIDAIFKHPDYAQHYTLEIIKRLVENDAKQRYTLKYCAETQTYAIKANQGHSMPCVKAEECLIRIENAEEVPMAVHGTYYRHWPKIRDEGLKCMGRNHIHFAITDNFMTEGTSGIRRNCQLLIYLNVPKVLMEGEMLLFRSENNVILSSGCKGRIDKRYFLKVIDRKSSLVLKY